VLILPFTDGRVKSYAPTRDRLQRLHDPLPYPCTSASCLICACPECDLPVEWGCDHDA
jgi:hypothetical protein